MRSKIAFQQKMNMSQKDVPTKQILKCNLLYQNVLKDNEMITYGRKQQNKSE